MLISIHFIHYCSLKVRTVSYRLCRKGQIWLIYCRKRQETLLITGFRGLHKKKKENLKICYMSMIQWCFAILRYIIYQKNLFWTEICKEPNGPVRYIQCLPCTIFSHTHKTAEDKENHTHKLLQMAHCCWFWQLREGEVPQDKGWVCTSSRQREHKGLLVLGSTELTWTEVHPCSVPCLVHKPSIRPGPLSYLQELPWTCEPLNQPTVQQTSALCLSQIYGSFNTWLQGSEPLSRPIPALLLEHTDTSTPATLSSRLEKVQEPLTPNGPTPVRTVGWHWHSILHIYKYMGEKRALSPRNTWLAPWFPHSSLLYFFCSKSPQILLYRITDPAFCPSSKHSTTHPEEFMDGLPLPICVMEMIIFLRQTWEEAGQDAPFLRLFPHLSPFHWVPCGFRDELFTTHLPLAFRVQLERTAPLHTLYLRHSRS